MENNYTKGKWNIRGNKIFVDDTFRSVANIHVIKNYKDITFEPIVDIEASANAKLICKAPSMYEAISDILETMNCGSGIVNVEWIKKRLENSLK